jgi:hypothetical protein
MNIFISLVINDQRDPDMRVKEELAETVAWMFNYRPVPYAKANEYLDYILLQEDRKEGFTREIYAIYLEKISVAAEQLVRKLKE